jgi:hypothetical protein
VVREGELGLVGRTEVVEVARAVAGVRGRVGEAAVEVDADDVVGGDLAEQR